MPKVIVRHSQKLASFLIALHPVLSSPSTSAVGR